MISSPHWGLSTPMFINTKSLTQRKTLIRIDVIHYESHALSLRSFKFLFQHLYWCFTAGKMFHWSSDTRKNKKDIKLSLCLLMVVDMKPSIYFIEVIVKHLHLVMSYRLYSVHETKQKNVNKLWRVHSMDWNHL